MLAMCIHESVSVRVYVVSCVNEVMGRGFVTINRDAQVQVSEMLGAQLVVGVNKMARVSNQ